jgi:hypothetical protein
MVGDLKENGATNAITGRNESHGRATANDLTLMPSLDLALDCALGLHTIEEQICHYFLNIRR